MRSTRASIVAHTTHHHCDFTVPDNEFAVFEPILSELNRRRIGEGGGSLWKHNISANHPHTKALFFEATTLLTAEMQAQLNQWVMNHPGSDGLERHCQRALANHYETSVELSSKCGKPLIFPHRDDVNDADISIVLGITPKSEFRGALLYISTEARNGNVGYEREGVPSRKRVIGVEVCKGVCVILQHKVQHYVSALQSGHRGSLVFHMTTKK